MNWLKQHKCFLTSFILNIILCILLLFNSPQKPINEVQYIPLHDTITITNVVVQEKTKILYENLTDTFYVFNSDTVFVEVPIEYKTYEDTIINDSAEARIKVDYHGAFSEIDGIKLDYKYNKQIQTVIQPQKKLGLGITVGPYIGYGLYGDFNTKQFSHGFEVGIGVSVGLTYKLY